MEFVDLVVAQNVLLQLGRTRQRVLVDFQQVVVGHSIGGHVKVAGVGQQKAQRVADAAVGVHDAGQNLVVNTQVARVVGRSHPQADDFRAHFAGDVLRRYGVAQRLGHLLALAVHGEAVGQQAAVGRAAKDGAGQQQRRVEPAAVLIVPFQVQVGLRAVVMVVAGVRAAQHVPEGGAGVEPHFQNVGALGVELGFFGAQNFFGGHAAPGLDTALLDHGRGLVDDFHGAGVQRARVHMQEEGDGHTPRTLARDAPVRTARDHGAQAILAVFGVEAGGFNGFQRDLAQGLLGLLCRVGKDAFAFVHADEPLGCGAVDDRRLVAPAMGVAVGQAGGIHQAIGHLQGVQNDGHCLPDVLAAKQGQVSGIHAVAGDWIQDVLVVQAIGHAGVEVVHPVCRRRVHDTGTVFSGGVFGQVHGRDAVIALVHVRQRVLEGHVIQRLALGGGDHRAFDLPACQALFHQRRCQHQQAALGVDQAVFQIGVDVQRLVGGNGPGGGGPDHHKGFFIQRTQAKCGGQFGRIGRGEHHVQRLRLLVGVFNFKLGQRGGAVKAPVHGLQTTVHKAAFHDLFERTQLVGLVRVVHGLVGVIPVTQHAKAFEVHHLLSDLLGGKGTALGLHFVAGQVAAMQFFDGVFNRQAVAVPAGGVQRVKAFELAALDDHVLQNLVHRVADVQLAVGVGRAVVQDELGCPAAGIAQLLVNALFIPLLGPGGLALGQVAAHGEGGVGHVQRGAVGGRFGLVRFLFRHGGTLRTYRALSAGRKKRGWSTERNAGARADGSERQIRSRVVWRRVSVYEAKNARASSQSLAIPAVRAARLSYLSSSCSLCKSSTRMILP